MLRTQLLANQNAGDCIMDNSYFNTSLPQSYNRPSPL